MMKFCDDHATCCWCGEEAYAGDQDCYYRWHGDKYCSWRCIAEAWKREHEAELFTNDDGYIVLNGTEIGDDDDLAEYLEDVIGKEVQETPLYTAEDHESVYGDYLYDVWRDEQLMNV